MTTTKPPAEVWLQWYGENLDGLAPDPNHAPAEGSVTWHHERVYDSDVGPYVLAVGMRERAEAAERELRDLRDEVAHARKERDEEHALRCDLERRFDHRLAGADDVRARARGARQTLEVNGYHAAAEAVTNLLVLLDTVDAQRIHEAELAREAIAHVRALLPPRDDIELAADRQARAWLEKVRV